MNTEKRYCSSIAIVGRPNVGKSTLLNQLIGQKVSITSSKAQTTHHRIIGIDTEGVYQAIYIDTPGLQIKEKRIIHRVMNSTANSAISSAELVIYVVEGTHWTPDDEMVLKQLRILTCPVLLAINKIDHVINKSKLLPHIAFLSQKMNFLSVVPISSKYKINIDIISNIVRNLLIESEHYFPNNYITDRSKRFMASEILREKLMRFLGGEVPHSVTVDIEQFVLNKRGAYNLSGLIIVERKGQKKIVIGKNGTKIKTIGIEARRDMEKMLHTKVSLKLWVKVNTGWADNESALRRLGYFNNISNLVS